MRIRIFSLASLLLLVLLSSACVGDAEKQVLLEQEQRAYERFQKDHKLRRKADLTEAGLYYDGPFFYVVMSLTGAGSDQYAQWACRHFLTTLYGYKAVEKNLVSPEEFFELALKWREDGIIEGKYSNLVRAKIRAKDVAQFRKTYREN